MRGITLTADARATSRNVPPVSYAKRGRTTQRPPVPKLQKKKAVNTGAVCQFRTSLMLGGWACTLTEAG